MAHISQKIRLCTIRLLCNLLSLFCFLFRLFCHFFRCTQFINCNYKLLIIRSFYRKEYHHNSQGTHKKCQKCIRKKHHLKNNTENLKKSKERERNPLPYTKFSQVANYDCRRTKDEISCRNIDSQMCRSLHILPIHTKREWDSTKCVKSKKHSKYNNYNLIKPNNLTCLGIFVHIKVIIVCKLIS